MRSRRRPHRRPSRARHRLQLRDVLLAHPGPERVVVVVVHPGRERGEKGTSASNDVNLCTLAGRVDSGRMYLHFDYLHPGISYVGKGKIMLKVQK